MTRGQIDAMLAAAVSLAKQADQSSDSEVAQHCGRAALDIVQAVILAHKELGVKE